MAHYAFLNDKNVVTEVITGIEETELIEGLDTETWYSNFRNQKCVRTSYNGRIRKNYASVGYKYDETLNAFIPPKPFTKWVLNEETCQWEAPEPYPIDGKNYVWNNKKGMWELNEQL
jgi:hypothetical protein